MKRLAALLLILSSIASPATAGDLGVKTPVRVAMPKTMVVDVEQSQVDLLGNKFSQLMEEFTGLKGTLEIGGEAGEVAKQLQEGKAHLGVFQSIEFAWIRPKHADSEPLMIALSGAKDVQAYVLVKKDSAAADLAALKGKALALPKKSKEHTRAYLTKAIEKAGAKDLKAFFKEITTPAGPEKALDDVIDGKADAAIVDKSSLDFYQRLKPGRFGQLKTIAKSEAFPPSVIVYRKDALEPALLERFKKGMLKANNSERGQDLMANWNITSFEAVPEDFQRNVEAIGKAYPAK